MIHPYLIPYAEELDERSYRVRLKNDIDHVANQAFADDQYWSGSWFHKFWNRFFRAKLRAAGLKLPVGSQVLDCCCGLGYLGEVFEQEFGAEVSFCDLSDSQLAQLRARRAATGAPLARIYEADVLDLPFEDSSFDWVVGNSFLHHLPDVSAALRELSRVTKDKGRVVFFHEPSDTAPFWESFPLSLLKDTRPTLKAGANFTDLWLFTADDLTELTRQTGFVEIDVFATGILSSILLNWYLIIAAKLRWRSSFGVYPAYLLRVWLNRIDLAFRQSWKTRVSPSIMIVARKN